MSLRVSYQGYDNAESHGEKPEQCDATKEEPMMLGVYAAPTNPGNSKPPLGPSYNKSELGFPEAQVFHFTRGKRKQLTASFPAHPFYVTQLRQKFYEVPQRTTTFHSRSLTSFTARRTRWTAFDRLCLNQPRDVDSLPAPFEHSSMHEVPAQTSTIHPSSTHSIPAWANPAFRIVGTGYYGYHRRVRGVVVIDPIF